MKAKIKLVANFSWEFEEVEYSPEVEKKINAAGNAIRDKILSVVGASPKADVHWYVAIQRSELFDLDKFLS
jgi:hypothetical protein